MERRANRRRGMEIDRLLLGRRPRARERDAVRPEIQPRVLHHEQRDFWLETLSHERQIIVVLRRSCRARRGDGLEDLLPGSEPGCGTTGSNIQYPIRGRHLGTIPPTLFFAYPHFLLFPKSHPLLLLSPLPTLHSSNPRPGSTIRLRPPHPRSLGLQRRIYPAGDVVR